LRHATDLVIDYPGGGFVAMNPEHHEERLRMWAVVTGRPVLALDYGKAPECERTALLGGLNLS
jgi:acetyl esterase/lipase